MKGKPMLKAVVRDGQIRPLEPLPVEWQEGQALRVERAEEDEASTDQVDRDFAVLASLCESSEPGDEEQFARALREARGEAKEHVRRQMGLP